MVALRLTNRDRWFLFQLYRWFPAILQVLAIFGQRRLRFGTEPDFAATNVGSRVHRETCAILDGLPMSTSGFKFSVHTGPLSWSGAHQTVRPCWSRICRFSPHAGCARPKRKWPISSDEIGRVKGRKQRSRRKYDTQDFEPGDHLLHQTAIAQAKSHDRTNC